MIPEAKLLITVPVTNDKLALHKLDVDKALEKASTDYLFVQSLAPDSALKGKAYSYQVVAKSRQGGLTYKLDSAPMGMEVSKDGQISWNVPADFKDAVTTVVLNVATNRARNSSTASLWPSALTLPEKVKKPKKSRSRKVLTP